MGQFQCRLGGTSGPTSGEAVGSRGCHAAVMMSVSRFLGGVSATWCFTSSRQFGGMDFGRPVL